MPRRSTTLLYLSEMLGLREIVLGEGKLPQGESLDRLRSDVLSCTRCELHRSKKHYVFGDGNPMSGLVFVGEAPGKEEDRTGIPFVGRAGALLNRLLEEIGIARDRDMYICNVLKCRPPGNRDPRPEEIEACSPYLKAQLEILSPEAICALGRFSANYLLDSSAPMHALRGRVHESPTGWKVVVTYHPAYLLRNPEAEPKVRDDLALLKRTLEGES
jgi:DNA polymerase